MNADLPSFLIQTAPGHYTLTFSSSGANTFSLCTYKYMWGYIAGIEAVAARAGQNYGTGLHLPLAYYYRWMMERKGVQEQCVAQCHDIIKEHFLANPQPTTGSKGKPEWRTAERAVQAFDAYVAHYGVEDFEVLGVEEPFEVALGEFMLENEKWERDITVTVRIRGIRDLRVKWHDQLWVLDHKTSTEWSDLAVDEGRASFQFMEYAWVERLLAQQRRETFGDLTKQMKAAEFDIPVGGVIGNYLISRAPYSEGRKPTPRDLPRDQFVREPYPYSEEQLAEWHEDAMDLAKEIFTRWQMQNWKRNRTACSHWGRCEYYRLCWETDAAYREAAAMSADYRPRTPSPFEELENGKDRQ